MIKLQIISIAITIILFYHLEWQFYIKKILKKHSYYQKPYDCFRCNLFWIGQVVGLFILPDYIAYIELTFLNFVTSFIIGKLQT